MPYGRKARMKADKDDAPEYLRRKRSQSFGKWSLAIALVSEELFEESVNTRNQHNQTYYNDSKHLPTSAVDAVSIKATRQPKTDRKSVV